MLQARGKTLISLLSLSQTVSLQQLSLAQGFWESSLCPSFGKAHKVRAGKTELSSALQGQEIPTKISTKKKKITPISTFNSVQVEQESGHTTEHPGRSPKSSRWLQGYAGIVTGLCLAFIFPHLGLFPRITGHLSTHPTNLCPGNSGPYLSPHCFALTNEDMDEFACRYPCQDEVKRSPESAKLRPCWKLCRNCSLDSPAPRADFLSSRLAQLPLLPPTWT